MNIVVRIRYHVDKKHIIKFHVCNIQSRLLGGCWNKLSLSAFYALSKIFFSTHDIDIGICVNCFNMSFS